MNNDLNSKDDRLDSDHISSRDIQNLDFTLGKRLCSTGIFDRIIDLYLIAVVGVILFIILSLDSVDLWLSEFIAESWARFVIKIVIFFIILYLVDRWLVCWRKRINLCTIDD
uniref:Transmembrane protein n=1 Tax=Pithovirus LCPAC201 TaxID=2506591 RepID=A0A481Z7U1_9VIRU|nr:MAG: hypothetical protein LCPAC201_00720 [Pithovirus LCPAC201]